MESWQIVLIAVATVLLLVGIFWGIVADARARAPVGEAEEGHPGMGAPKHNRSPEAKARARARAKAARRQRKANR